MTSNPSVATSLEAPAKQGLLGTLGDLYAAPQQAFETIAARPRVWLALLLLMGLNLVFASVWLSRLDVYEFIRAQSAAAGQPAPPLEQVPVGFVKGSIFANAIVFPPLVLMVIAGLQLFLFKVVRGAELTFRHSLAVVAWATLAVSLLSVPLMLLVMGLKGDWNLNPQTVLQASPGAFFDSDALPKPLHAFLSGLDLFTLWTVWLVSVGYGQVTRRGTGWAAVTVFGVWAALLAIVVAWAAF